MSGERDSSHGKSLNEENLSCEKCLLRKRTENCARDLSEKYVGAFMNMQELVFVNGIYTLLHVETSIAKIKFSDNIQISISEGELW